MSTVSNTNNARHRVNKRVEIIDTLPKPETLPDGTIYGNYSVVLPSKMKLIPYHSAVVLGDRLGTQTSFTREYMGTLGKRTIRREEFWSYLQARPPMTVKPCTLKDAVYIDIASAYPSIYKWIGWGSDYVRGKYWGVHDRIEYPFTMSWKVGRSFIVTGARHIQFGRHIHRGKVVTKPFISVYSNPPLVAGVYDVLCAVGRFATYATRAVYWNIDGGIMPAKAVPMFTAFCESIGLQARIKHQGDALIMTGGYWKIGGHETRNFQAGKKSNIIGGDYNPLDIPSAEWVVTHFKKLVEMKG